MVLPMVQRFNGETGSIISWCCRQMLIMDTINFSKNGNSYQGDIHLTAAHQAIIWTYIHM